MQRYPIANSKLNLQFDRGRDPEPLLSHSTQAPDTDSSGLTDSRASEAPHESFAWRRSAPDRSGSACCEALTRAQFRSAPAPWPPQSATSTTRPATAIGWLRPAHAPTSIRHGAEPFNVTCNSPSTVPFSDLRATPKSSPYAPQTPDKHMALSLDVGSPLDSRAARTSRKLLPYRMRTGTGYRAGRLRRSPPLRQCRRTRTPSLRQRPRRRGTRFTRCPRQRRRPPPLRERRRRRQHTGARRPG